MNVCQCIVFMENVFLFHMIRKKNFAFLLMRKKYVDWGRFWKKNLRAQWKSQPPLLIRKWLLRYFVKKVMKMQLYYPPLLIEMLVPSQRKTAVKYVWGIDFTFVLLRIFDWTMESFIQCSIFCFSLYINYVLYVWVVHGVVSLVSKFSVKHPNCLITFYKVKKV
jgi:hypothetical protein